MLVDLAKSWRGKRYELSCPIAQEADDSFSLSRGIVVRVPKAVGCKVSPISATDPLIEKRADDFGFDLDSFTGDATTSFGFGEVLKHVETDNYFEFVGNVPRGRSGEYEEPGGKKARRLLVSIDLLLWHLNYADIDLPSTPPQLMYVDVSFNRSSPGYSCGIMVTYSERMAEWFWWQPSLGVVERAMQVVYEQLSGTRPYPNVQLRKDGLLNLHCTSGRPGLHPGDNAERGSGGYQFATHNIQTPLQMLTLLAGLCALHDRAKEEVDLMVD
jgi:hypothetical protein